MDRLTPSTLAGRQALFKQHIARYTRKVLRDIPPAPHLLPDQLATQMLHLLPYALAQPEAWPDTRRLLRTAASGMEQAAHWDKWTQQLVSALTHSRQHDDAETEAELLRRLGILYQRRSRFAEARRHLEASAEAYQRLDHSRGLAQALNQQAYLARLQRRFDDAEQLIERVHGLLAEDDDERAFSDYVLGLIALDKREWPKSIEFSYRTAELATRTHQPHLVGRSLLCCSVALERAGNLEEAAEICHRAIKVFDELGDSYYQAIAQMNLGNVYLSFDQWQVALGYYYQAKAIFQKAEDWVHLGHINHNIGISCRRVKNWQRAEEAYLAGIDYWQRVDNVERWVNTMDGLGLTYLEQDKVEQAGTVFVRALERLWEIEGQPGYNHWLIEVTAHLAQVSEALQKKESHLEDSSPII